jgi:low affinity Fe/Cu permease
MNKSWFSCAAEKIAYEAGQPGAFLAAALIVIAWAITGPFFGYSEVWQLVINTGTTIITFLMVFLIQNMQNRDTAALHLKLDELIRATQGAHTTLIGLDELSDADIKALHNKYSKLAAEARQRLLAGGQDTDIPEVIIQETKAEKIKT